VENANILFAQVLACRQEIVAYDRKEGAAAARSLAHAAKGCFGCACATSEHCLTLLKALAAIPEADALLRASGLVAELVERNLHRRTSALQQHVRQLLCLLATDQPDTTSDTLLTQRISLALSSPASG